MQPIERVTESRIHVGVDLGQRRDHTAVVVLEDKLVMTGRKCPTTFANIVERRRQLHLMQRIGLGTEYHKVVRYLERLTGFGRLEKRAIWMAVDTTGVGLVVVEMLRRANLQGTLLPVVFTGGDATRYQGGFYSVPKGELMHGLGVLLDAGEMVVRPRVANWKEMLEEMLGMRREFFDGGVKWRSVGKHDDLVMALALAVWSMRRHGLPLGKEALGRWERERWLR
jgi:hypothetical protein